MTSCVRLATEADAAAIAEIYRPIVESTAISFEVTPPDEREMARRIRETLAAHAWLVYDCDGAIGGYAYAAVHRVRAAYRWSVDTSAYVDARHRRQGIGHGLYVSLLAVLAAQGYVNAYAGIALPNAASVALHERVGFAPIGVYRNVGHKLGTWHDVGWWQRALRSHQDEPRPTRTIAEVQDSGDWDAVMARGLECSVTPSGSWSAVKIDAPTRDVSPSVQQHAGECR